MASASGREYIDPMLHDALAGIWRPWRELLAGVPSQCAVCHAWPARRVCDSCVARFAAPGPRCATCAVPVPAGVAQCGACVRHPPPVDACLAAVDYGYPWAQVLAAFKFQGDPGWAAALADLLRQAPGVAPALAAADLLVPVPLSRERLRERGFNQTLMLARCLAPGLTRATLLLRTRDTPSQSSLPRERRLRNLRGAFALEPLQAPAVAGRRVLLLDDVMTTGATLHAAARVLRAAGAAHITALALARTP